MVRIWLAVLNDLYRFARYELWMGQEAVLTKEAKTIPLSFLVAPAPKLSLAYQPPLVLPEKTSEPLPDTWTEPVVMYVAVSETPCFVAPHQDFDGMLTSFVYGTAVTVVSYQGRYARVQRQQVEGWVEKDALEQKKTAVWPQLLDEAIYEATDETTFKIRQLLGDVFYAGALGLPLQAGEYCLYRLLLENRLIIWPNVRPRSVGQWQVILRGVLGIHISVTPKTGTLMEWTDETGEGRIAYVEKVAPDSSLAISLVGYSEPGRYTEHELAVEQWREWRPVFIEVL